MKAVFLVLALCALTVSAQSPASAPTDCPSVIEVASGVPELSTLVEALELDGLQSSLGSNTPYPLTYTVFAPTNDAFSALLESEGLSNLTELQETTGVFDDILQYHFLITPYTEAQLVSLGSTDTNFRNQTLTFTPDGTVIAASTNATIVQADIPACESIIHIIDNVLIPDFAAPPAVAPGALASS